MCLGLYQKKIINQPPLNWYVISRRVTPRGGGFNDLCHVYPWGTDKHICQLGWLKNYHIDTYRYTCKVLPTCFEEDVV